MPRALILEPVRELALQVQEQVNLFSAHVNLSSELFIGGVNIGPQIRRAAQSVDIMIATPGRLLDLFDRGALLLIGVEILVIDEADRMLDMGFIPDIESIVAKLPVRRQTMMLSATMPPEIGRIAKRFLQRPARVSVAPPAATTELVEQSVIHCRASDKDRTLRTLLGSPAVESALVFCNRKRTVDELVGTLRRDRVPVEPLHGDMPQPVASRRWKHSGPATSASWWPRTWPVAGSTCKGSATSSTTTCRPSRKITCTISVAPGAPGISAPPSRLRQRANANMSRPSKN